MDLYLWHSVQYLRLIDINQALPSLMLLSVFPSIAIFLVENALVILWIINDCVTGWRIHCWAEVCLWLRQPFAMLDIPTLLPFDCRRQTLHLWQQSMLICAQSPLLCLYFRISITPQRLCCTVSVFSLAICFCFYMQDNSQTSSWILTNLGILVSSLITFWELRASEMGSQIGIKFTVRDSTWADATAELLKFAP